MATRSSNLNYGNFTGANNRVGPPTLIKTGTVEKLVATQFGIFKKASASPRFPKAFRGRNDQNRYRGLFAETNRHDRS